MWVSCFKGSSYLLLCLTGGGQDVGTEATVWWEIGTERGAEKEIRAHWDDVGPSVEAGVWAGRGEGSLGNHCQGMRYLSRVCLVSNKQAIMVWIVVEMDYFM